jgi:hypothetical protein
VLYVFGWSLYVPFRGGAGGSALFLASDISYGKQRKHTTENIPSKFQFYQDIDISIEYGVFHEGGGGREAREIRIGQGISQSIYLCPVPSTCYPRVHLIYWSRYAHVDQAKLILYLRRSV